jgi:hypothetical protein
VKAGSDALKGASDKAADAAKALNDALKKAAAGNPAALAGGAAQAAKDALLKLKDEAAKGEAPSSPAAVKEAAKAAKAAAAQLEDALKKAQDAAGAVAGGLPKDAAALADAAKEQVGGWGLERPYCRSVRSRAAVCVSTSRRSFTQRCLPASCCSKLRHLLIPNKTFGEAMGALVCQF